MSPKPPILVSRPLSQVVDEQPVDRSAFDGSPLTDVRCLRDSSEEPTAKDARVTEAVGGGAKAWVRKKLGAHGAHRAIFALTMLLVLPTLWQALDSDDYLQIESLNETPRLAGLLRAPWDLYAYAKDVASNVALREEGVWPWWTDTEVVMSFFRPIASLTRAVDHWLWPNHVWLMQLHSLAWFACLLGVVSALYRRLSPTPWVAAVALLLFGVDEARAATIGWLCNRNALVALVFSFGALLMHHRARTMGSRRAAWGAPLLFALGLLGGEGALQVCGYLAAYALFLDRATPARRLVALLPYGAIVIAWAAIYKTLGYGAVYSGFYIDPLREPLTFVSVLPERLIIYGQALFEGVSADWFNLLPLFGIAPRPYLLPLAVVLAGVMAVAVAPLFRRDPLVRFWSVGALLAMLPTCGASPSDRLLGGAALGGMGLLATLLCSLFEGTHPRPRRWLYAFGCMLAVMNFVVAPALLVRFLTMVDSFDEVLARSSASLPNTDEVRAQTVVLMNPPFDTYGLFMPAHRAYHGQPKPKHFRWLATGVYDLRVTRVDAHTLKLAPKPGFLANSSQLMLRSLRRPMQVGEEVRLEGVRFEILSLTPDRRPAEVLVRFDEPLDAPSMRFMRWDRHDYVPFTLPAIGRTVELPAVDMTAALAGPG